MVLLDACFSGKSREGVALLDGLRPLLPVAEAAGSSKVLVLSAASGDEVSGPFAPVRQGLFSYFAVGGLRGWADLDGNGTVTGAELSTYVSRGVASALTDGSRSQTPNVNAKDGDARLSWTLSEQAGEQGPDLAALALGDVGATGGLGIVGAAPGPSGGPVANVPAFGSAPSAVPELRVELAPDGTYRICQPGAACLTENDFVRRYRSATGLADLDVFERRKNTGGTIAWCTASAVGLGGGAYGIYGYTQAATSSGGLTDAGDVWKILLISLGGSVGLAALAPCIGGIGMPDGTVYDHDLTEDDARAGVQRFNEAMRRKHGGGGVGVRPLFGPGGAGLVANF